MRRFVLVSSFFAVACIAEEREPAPVQIPGDEPPGDDWSPRGEPGDLESSLASTSSAAPAYVRADPRPLPSLSPTELEAKLSLVDQELAAGLDDLAHAELMLRRASLLLARDQAGDREAAISTLTKLVSTPAYQHYKRLDHAWFYLAYEHGRAGDVEGLKRASLELIRLFPASQWIPEAYVLYGDYYFGEQQPTTAAQFYEKVASGFPKSPAGAYAEYRWAWCVMIPEPERALEHFVRVIRRAKDDSSAESARLADAARHDVPISYARVGKPTKAKNFFEFLDREHAGEMLQDLVSVYQDTGDTDAAHVVCQDMRRASLPTQVCTDGS